MTYNLSNFSGANNFLDMAVASNYLVDGWLFFMVVVVIFVITFINMKGYETRYALLSASFITFLLTASLWGVGLAPERAVVITFVLMLFSLAFVTIAD